MKNKRIIITIFIVLGFILCIGLFSMFYKEKKQIISHKEVEQVYKTINVENCTSMPYIEGEVSVDQMNDTMLIYLIFNQMKQEGILKNEIDYQDYRKIGKKLFGTNKVLELPKNYIFDGYSYQMKDDKIVRIKGTCGKRKYISKLYGYSISENRLEIDVTLGYIENKKVYNLDGKELGEYKKEYLNSLLDHGTFQMYIYKLESDEYKLQSISRKK